MKKVIVYNGYKSKYKDIDDVIETLDTFAYVMDLSEKEWNELSSTLLDIDQKVYQMLEAGDKDIGKVFDDINVPFKKQLKKLYKRHGAKVDWNFLPCKEI